MLMKMKNMAAIFFLLLLSTALAGLPFFAFFEHHLAALCGEIPSSPHWMAAIKGMQKTPKAPDKKILIISRANIAGTLCKTSTDETRSIDLCLLSVWQAGEDRSCPRKEMPVKSTRSDHTPIPLLSPSPHSM